MVSCDCRSGASNLCVRAVSKMSGLRVRGEAMGDTKGSEDEPASSMDMTMGFMSMLDSVEAGEGKTDSATRGGEEEGKEGKTETASPAAGKSAGKPVPQASMTLMSQVRR